jgi:hypothetical protein
MISLGGKVKGGNIEVHDVQFVAAEHIDDTVEILKRNWYGQAEKLHMDSYKKINGADGFQVGLTKKKPDSKKELFFAHLGGYRSDSTQEQHEAGLFVGEYEAEVKERARSEKIAADIENHVDSLIRIEQVMMSTDGEQYYLELSEASEVFDQAPDWFGYRRLDKE